MCLFIKMVTVQTHCSMKEILFALEHFNKSSLAETWFAFDGDTASRILKINFPLSRFASFFTIVNFCIGF